jgi:flagellar hook-basal body complex protein FliE
MINELYKLSQSLEHYGLLKSTTHPDINKVGKADCLFIELNEQGRPSGLRLLQKEQTAELWKHSKGCHNNFPAIRVKKPLLLPKESQKIDDNAWKRAKLSEKISMLSQLDYSTLNRSCNDIKISEWTEKQLNPVLLSKQPTLAALKQLIAVFPHEGQQTNFLQDLIQLLHQEIQRCEQEDLLDIIKKLLIGIYDSKKEKFIADCMTYYDMYSAGKYNNSVSSSETRNALIELLKNISVPKDSKTQETTVISPFTGHRTIGIGNKYPNPNIPLLGLTYLYSKKSDIPCLTRYNMTGTDAFQAGKKEINDINDAVAFLTDDSRKNKTWCSMSDSNREKPNLLMAYLPDEPQNNAQLAKVLGDPSDFDDAEEYQENAESSYEALCKQVIGSLNDVMRKNQNTKINLIILETLDPGRKQIVYENVFTAKQFRENLLIWNNASRNTPPIKIRIRKGKETVNVKLICPGPSEICQLFKINYTHSGAGKSMKQSDVSLHEIYRLYMANLQENRKQTLNRFFQLTVQKSRWLLGNTAYQMITDYALPSTKQSQTQAKQVAMFAPLLSILLYLSNIRKENYMLDAPFNVGQFLKLSDMLHKEYCVQVRNSGNKQASLPAQLMGNDMLSIASENPVEGLNRLRDRMRIYLAWAQGATGENAGYAKWILARFEEVSRKIANAENELPEHFTPVQQAQVLLGYLADVPYEKKKQDPSDKSNLKEENSNG